jgi:hypothetical protein
MSRVRMMKARLQRLEGGSPTRNSKTMPSCPGDAKRQRNGSRASGAISEPYQAWRDRIYADGRVGSVLRWFNLSEGQQEP